MLNQNATPGSPAFFEGNTRFLTKRLWAVGSKPNYFHHGQFTTIREAILSHFAEALQAQQKFALLSPYQQGAVVEFLKTLQMFSQTNAYQPHLIEEAWLGIESESGLLI